VIKITYFLEYRLHAAFVSGTASSSELFKRTSYLRARLILYEGCAACTTTPLSWGGAFPRAFALKHSV